MQGDPHIHSKLTELLPRLDNWQKVITSIPGVKLIKIPPKSDMPERFGIEINPVDAVGKPLKKTGALVITNMELFERYVAIMQDPKVHRLMEEIEKIRATMPDLVL